MSIPSGIRTPGAYIDVNINTQRSGLLSNTQKVLFLTIDSPESELTGPVSVYDKTSADAAFGSNSVAGQMMTAAINTYRFVSVEVFPSGESQPLAT